MRNILIALVAIAILGCENKESGNEITYFENGSESLEVNNVLLLWVKYQTEDGKPLFGQQPTDPLPLLYDSTTEAESGMIKSYIDRLKVGDSVFFKLPAKNLWEVSFKRDLPDSIGETSNILVNMKIVDQMSQADYKTYRRELDEERNRRFYEQEENQLAQYFDENKINAVETESGLRYVIKSEGSGKQAEVNKLVNVKYHGMLLDGSTFDQGTYEFRLGTGAVIKGWDEGIDLLRVGSTATLYIPSKLGYGGRGSGRIAPYSSLIFDVELLDVKD